MAVLSAYIGSSNVSALLYLDADKYCYLSFPFVYSEVLYSNYASETDFYKEVFDYFCKQNKVKLSDCDLVLTTDTPMDLSVLEPKMLLNINEVMQLSQEHFPIMVDACSVRTPRNILSYIDLKRTNIINTEEVEDVEMDYYANLILYPQVVPADMPAKIEIDKSISAKTYANPLTFSSENPLVFTGPRFDDYFTCRQDEELDYMLMMSMLNSAGIYDVSLDRKMSVLLLPMLRRYLNSEVPINNQVEKAGVVVNSNGAVECLITTDMGTSQLVDVDKDRIFIVPLGQAEKVRILIKSSSFGTVEKWVEGGKLGLIFDTREVKADLASDIKVFDYSMHLFSQALIKI